MRAQGLEDVQVVLACLRRDVTGLAGQMAAGGVHVFAGLVEHRRHGILGQPLHLHVRLVGPQGLHGGKVTAGMAEPDRRGHVQHPLAPRPCPRPGPFDRLGAARAGRRTP